MPAVGLEPTEAVRRGIYSPLQLPLCDADLVERDGIRTRDLLHAMQALFQLSYTPRCLMERDGTRTHNLPLAERALYH